MREQKDQDWWTKPQFLARPEAEMERLLWRNPAGVVIDCRVSVGRSVGWLVAITCSVIREA